MTILIKSTRPPVPSDTARLLIACPDARGIVAAVATFIAEHGGNLLESEQHTDPEHGEFFMRIEFDLDGCDLNRSNFNDAWSPMARQFNMNWEVRFSTDRKRIGILVGKSLHCLQELLWRWEAGELAADIAVVVSNHDKAARTVEHAGIPFVHLPIVDDDKVSQEARIRETLEAHQCDTIVLARYMQILSDDFVSAYQNRIINIHHSFLPAFAGGDPYRRAYDRGVKIIGATSHFVTAELDAGPIIAQEIVRVSHRESVRDLRHRGRDLERIVLARAVQWFTQDKILVTGNKTVVFS